MREFGFELRLCAHLETTREGVVARQLGGGVLEPGTRVVDVVHVTPGPEFDRRRRMGATTIPRAVLEAEVGVGRWQPVTEVLDGPPARARELADAAAEAGFLELARRGGRTVVRRATGYPDWFDTMTAVENKPDLDRPGDMAAQLRFDAALGLFDRVVLATADRVTGAHLNRLPEAVGVWRFDPDGGSREVVREPTDLGGATAGTEVRAERPLRTDVGLVDAAAAARARRRVAERAWGKGWRTYELPGCGACEPTEAGLPACTHFGRVVDPATECGPSCPGHDPAEPPAVDLAARRATRTAWDPDPPGVAREQSGLNRFL